mgnify:CR=1 FL=1
MQVQKKSSKSRKNNGSADHEITVAINSETGSLDPAGSIALTYLAYSVSALDELLTFDENGEIEYRAAQSYEVNEDFYNVDVFICEKMRFGLTEEK